MSLPPINGSRLLPGVVKTATMPCSAHGAVFLRDPLPPTCKIQGLCHCLWALSLVSRQGHCKACRPTWYSPTYGECSTATEKPNRLLSRTCSFCRMTFASPPGRPTMSSRSLGVGQWGSTPGSTVSCYSLGSSIRASRSGLRGLYSPALLCSWGPPGQEEIFRGP